ncbi:MAG: hypothetical protein WD114_02890 [Phycisphaerales bacterium]
MKLRITMTGLLALAAFSAPALSDTLTVGPNFNDYDFITITAAIANAAGGDEIVIQPGLYAENLLITGKDLTLRNAGGGEVVIFGQNLNKCLRVTGAGTDVVLEGLTFSNGFSTSAGGGVAIEVNTTAQITDCVIEDSITANSGGGLYMSGGGTVTNTIIRGNSANATGGGIHIAGMLSKAFIDCVIEDNSASDGGGFGYAAAGDIATISGCSFLGNTASRWGGAIALLGTGSAGIMETRDCVFSMNHADEAGGAVWVSDQDVIQALNCVFEFNTAADLGGAVRNEQIFEAINCTFVNNDVLAPGVSDTFESLRADANTNLLNTIVVNASAASHTGAGQLNPFFSLVPEAPSGMTDANGNFSADPMFVDAAGGDYRLAAGSPAIDAGDSRGIFGGASFGYISVLDVQTDINGDVRNLDDPDTENTGVSVWELCIDLGAFEFQPQAAAECTADLNDDGMLNFFDISAFLSAFSAGCP